LLYGRDNYPDYWDRITGYFREHAMQAKIAAESDGVSSLTAALEGNLGIALLSKSSDIDRGQKQRLISRPIAVEPAKTGVAAGISTGTETSDQLLSFIEELKQAAKES
jgi:DNA-binding transcriptional LysR family regulator